MEKGAVVVRLLFFLAFLSLILFVQRFWFLNAWRRIQELSNSGARHILQGAWFLALGLLLLTILDPFLGRVIPRRAPGIWLIAASRIWLIASVFGFLAFQAVALFGWASGAAVKLMAAGKSNFDPARRTFFQYAAYLAGSLPFVAASYGFAAGRFNYRIRKVDVPIANLPKELNGMKIVQLSDIHAGEFMPEDEVRRGVSMANSLGADIAVVTGDFISNENDPLEACIAELSKLRAPLGVWGCNGNHEIYADAEDAAQMLFSRHGMRLLRQESVELEFNRAKFNLIGVDYQRDHMTRQVRKGPMLQEIEHLVRRDVPNILLSHNPNSFYRAADLGIELSLAGHTHGGQVKVEIVDRDITPARLITDFVAGFYQLPMKNGVHDPAVSVPANTSSNGHAGKSAALYVNRGLGTFAMPVRLGVPPEITLLTLRQA